MILDATDRTVRMAVTGILVLVLALAACGGAETGGEKAGQETTQVAQSAGSYPLPGEQVFPEGIAYQAQSGDFFVGSTTDGAIYRGNVENEGEEAEVFLEPGSDGRETAVGMKVDPAGKLFIAGGDTGRIFVYDTTSGDIVEALDTPESEMTFINDGEGFPDPSLRYPTTIAGYDGRLLVVNSQFDRRNSGEEPDLPFTISAVEVP